jgi:hypothetical protein
MIKRVLLLVLILTAGAGLALGVVDIASSNSTIVQDSNQFAKYDIKLHNPYGFEDTFLLKIKDYSWNIWSDPLADYVGGGVDLPANENYTAKLFIRPLSKKSVGTYSIPLYVISKRTGDEYRKNLIVDIVSGRAAIGEYALGILVNVDLPIIIDPRERAIMRVTVQNLFPRNITGIKLVVDSQLIKSESTFELWPLGEQVIDFPIEFSKNQAPISDRIELMFFKDGEKFKSEKFNYQIMSYSDVTTLSDEITKSFLRSERRIALFNNGNIPVKHQFPVKVNWVQRIFTSTSPVHYILKNEEGTFMMWELKLGPQTRGEIIIAQNYIVLFWILIAFAVFGLFYWFMRSPILLTKEANVLEIRDGAVSKLKVLIHIRNRTNQSLSAIRVADRVPDIATVEDDFDVGTIRPEKIVKNMHGGTVIKWSIPKLDPYEERIISYKIKSRLHVLGNFVLPTSVTKFTTSGGAELKAKSNKGRITHS